MVACAVWGRNGGENEKIADVAIGGLGFPVSPRLVQQEGPRVKQAAETIEEILKWFSHDCSRLPISQKRIFTAVPSALQVRV